MKRKRLAIGIILLFIGTSVIPAMAQNTEKPSPVSRGNWYYVGGHGPGNYSRIQDAINHTSDGDTVYVFDDLSPYDERLTINTKITLIGEDQATTIIHSGWEMNGSAIAIRADNISLRGFTISTRDCAISVLGDHVVLTDLCIQGDYSCQGISLYYASYTLISWVTVNQTQVAIDTHYAGISSNTTIEHCLFLNCTGCAIGVEGPDSIICDNTLYNCHSGIILSSDRNQVLHNTIIAGGLRRGIWVYSTHNLISGNVLIRTGFDLRVFEDNIYMNNTVNGNPFVFLKSISNQTIENAGQVILAFCTDILIKNSEISYCRFGIQLSATTNSLVLNCTVVNCSEGITLDSAYDNRIQSSTITGCDCSMNLVDGSRNTLDNNTVVGGGIVIVSNDTLVSHNEIDACDVGIDLGDHFADIPSYRNNTIRRNIISHCTTGLLLYFCRDNIIAENNFVKNRRQATFRDSNHNRWMNNYWGRPIYRPRIIYGSLFSIEYDWGYSTFSFEVPWINLDRHPAQEPYDIPGVN